MTEAEKRKSAYGAPADRRPCCRLYRADLGPPNKAAIATLYDRRKGRQDLCFTVTPRDVDQWPAHCMFSADLPLRVNSTFYSHRLC